MSQNGFSFNLVLGHFWNINFAVLWSEMIEIWSVLLDADFLQFPSERSETGKLRAAFFSNNLSKFSQFSHFFWSASHDHHCHIENIYIDTDDNDGAGDDKCVCFLSWYWLRCNSFAPRFSKLVIILIEYLYKLNNIAQFLSNRISQPPKKEGVKTISQQCNIK